jgi:regulator of protease activity HflC (stomatin/prohibitin superfamily)
MLTPLLSLMLVSLVLLALTSVRRVPEGQVYSLRRVGGHTRFVGAGTHFVLPLFEHVSHRMSLSGSTIEVRAALSSGEDCSASVYFQVLDPQRADNVIESVDTLLHERARDLLGSSALPADPLERRAWLKQGLNSEVRERGLLVTRIDLRNAA